VRVRLSRQRSYSRSWSRRTQKLEYCESIPTICDASFRPTRGRIRTYSRERFLLSLVEFSILRMAQRQSFLLDGTLSNLKQARENVLRCLKSKRPVQILYVYQDPLQAWKFVQAREAEEGRNVPVERFIEQYFAARDVVNALKSEFGTDIMVDLLVKPNDSVGRLYKAGIDQIDNHVKEKYDRVGLVRVLAGDQE
jgi:hypothetical protein